MIVTNPFPAFAVETEFQSPEAFKQRSVPTSARTKLEEFLEAYQRSEFENCHISIRGDYGTGKTHLLRWAQAFFEQSSDKRTDSKSTMLTGFTLCSYTNAVGASFSDYFYRQIAQQFSKEMLEDMFARFHATVAQAEAKRLSVTRSAVDFIEKDYHKTEELLDASLLPESRIADAMEARLEESCGYAEVAHVLSGIGDSNKSAVAYRWLTQGPDLKDRDLDTLGVKIRLDCDEIALAAAKGIVAVLSGIGIRWIVLIDQFEHLMRTEQVQGTEHIQQWFKEFLVAMSKGHGVIIAGHYDAWNVQQDFAKRFLTPPIEIRRLSKQEIHDVLAKHLEVVNLDVSKLGDSLEDLLEHYSRGNIRTLLVLCHVLVRRHGEQFFDADEKVVQAAYDQIRHIRTVDAIEGYVTHSLQQAALTFEMNVDTAGLRDVSFVVPDHYKPQLLLNVLEATIAEEEASNLIGLVDQTTLVQQQSSGVRVVMILTGYVTDALQEEINQWGYETVDATSPTFEQDVRQLIRSVASGTVPKTASSLVAPDRIDQLVERLDRIESEAREQRHRLQSELQDIGSLKKTTLDEIQSHEFPESKEYLERIDIKALFPEKISRFKYIGALTKISFIVSSITLFLALLSVFSKFQFDIDYLSFGDPLSLVLLLRRFFIVFLSFWLVLGILFYLDWSVVDSFLDRLTAIRHRRLAMGMPVYKVLRDEQQALGILSAHPSLIWLRMRFRLNKLISEFEEVY